MLQWFFFLKNIYVSITQCLDITLLCYESHTWNSSNSDILDIPIAQILDLEKVSRCTLLSAGLRRNFVWEWIWMVAPAPAFRLPFPCCFQFSWPVRFCKKKPVRMFPQMHVSHTSWRNLKGRWLQNPQLTAVDKTWDLSMIPNYIASKYQIQICINHYLVHLVVIWS